MNEIISKITPYNLFNYLIPGVVFYKLCDFILDFDIFINQKHHIIINLMFLYFLGLILSRIGSLFLDRMFKYRNNYYEDFISASEKDSKIEILSEQNNVYRTMASVSIVALLVQTYSSLASFSLDKKDIGILVVCVILFYIFIQSYKKQSEYLCSRIKHFTNNNKGENNE